MSFVSFENVSKAFGNKKVIDNLSFSIERRHSLAVMGPSGSGKTTIINLLLGFENVDCGKIVCPNKTSVVFQEDRLSEDFSVLSNTTVGSKSKEKKAAAVKLLGALGLAGEEKTPVRELSGGMKRRVAIARALCTDAEFYIFDEPFKGLDEGTWLDVLGVVKAFMKDKAFLLITHNEKEATALCDDMLVLE